VLSFSKKVAIVTGGGGGIGASVAKSFAEAGARVVVTDIRRDAAEMVAHEIEDSGGSAIGEGLDVRCYGVIEKVVARTVQLWGQINIVVNCAGILSIDRFEDVTESLWDEIMGVNAKGIFLVCKSVAQQMIRQGAGGKIVNVSSVAGKIGVPLYVHYCASKFAVLGITKSLALELAKHRINVNAVCPGDVETSMLEYEFERHARLGNTSSDAVKRDYLSRAPLGRFAKPQDVADVVLFLASDKADYMTGQALNITGGRMTF